MPLTTGSRVGSYEVLAKLGEGGMGEVYRATDTRLNRDVALKILPEAFAADADRLARFTREAQTLASLNHPHIAQIYGLEKLEGREGQLRMTALVMELVEGEDLSEHIARGPIPWDEALPLVRQIADALAAAHEQGIIHRDLKPANVKIRHDGTVKVLDFGLAKAVDAAPAGAPGRVSMSPTLTANATMAGMILGTAAYMAPEQARGKAVDERADVWAFGVVLYEMLSGKRAFEDEDISMTLSKILQREPDFEALPSSVPARVRQVLRLCLRKDPKERFADIRDVRLALEGAFETAAPHATAPPLTSPKARRASRLAWAFGGGGLLLAAALVVPATRHLLETPPRPQVVSTTIVPPDNAEFDFRSTFALPVLSPDGTRIVFGARAKEGKTQLWLRRLDSPVAQPLQGTEDAVTPFWSPDSRWVAFGQTGKLKKIDLQGGPPTTVADLAAPLRGGSWNTDGVIIVAVNAPRPILRVSAAGGTLAPAITQEKGKETLSQRSPWFLPDGRHFLYTLSMDGEITAAVGWLDEPNSPGKIVAHTNSTVMYAQGELLYLREDTLMAQPFDVNRLETTGEAVPVVEGVPTFTSPSRIPGFTVSSTGMLAYQTGALAGHSRLVWKDRKGITLRDLGDTTGRIGDVALSPDGTRAAVNLNDASGHEDIWIYDVARGIPTRFTFDPARERSPIWTTDGKTIYFISDRKGSQFDLFRRASDFSGTDQLVIDVPARRQPTGVSPDGKLLLFTEGGSGTGTDVWLLPLGAAPGAKVEPRVFLKTPFNEQYARFSPDGQWIAYESNESGTLQVYVAPYPGPGGKRQISSGGGMTPQWRSDGKELFFNTNDGQLMAAETSIHGGTLDIGPVQKLFDGIITNRGTLYDVAAGGQKFLVVDDGVTAAAPLTLLQNWTSAPKR